MKPQTAISQKSTGLENDVCPVCHGTGWELYRPDQEVYDELNFPSDYSKVAHDYARKCQACGGMKKSDYDKTGTPEAFYEADIYKFDFNAYNSDMTQHKKIIEFMFNNFKKWQDEDKGLYIYSKTPGSGKTFLACCLGKSLMMKYHLTFRFITAGDYLATVSESYEREKGALDPTLEYKNADILVLDDIGAQHDSKGGWERTEMFKLINWRMAKRMVTIYTSNVEIAKLNLDERTKDRIYATTVFIPMPEQSIRDKKAEESQSKFLEGVI